MLSCPKSDDDDDYDDDDDDDDDDDVDMYVLLSWIEKVM